MPKRGPRPVPRCWLHFQRRDHPTTKSYKEKRRYLHTDQQDASSGERRKNDSPVRYQQRHNTSISSPGGEYGTQRSSVFK